MQRPMQRPPPSPPSYRPPGAAPDRVFTFRYTVFNVEARIDERRVEVRAGVRTSAAPIDRLQHLYVHADRARGVDELLLSYALPGGRLRRIRVFADGGQEAFARLVDALLAARPDIDIRHLDRREAWDRTGSRELDRVVLPAMMALAILALGVVFTPRILHGFDRGHATIDAEALGRGERPDTRNLTVHGRVALEHAVFAESEAEAPSETATAWLPLAGPDWSAADPVPALLEVRHRRRADILALAERDRFDGILRDIAWEGLDARRRRALIAAGLLVPEGVALVEYGATPNADLAVALGVIGLLGAMMLGVMIALRRRVQAAARTDRRAPLNRPRGPGIDDDVD